MEPHEQAVIQYYTDHTKKFYLDQWDQDDIHFGLFNDEESIHFYRLVPAQEKIKKSGILRMTEAVVSPAKICSTDTVVDAGCGVGGTAIYLAQKYGCHVIGINISRHQMDIAAQKVEEAGLSHLIQFQYGDCSQHLPLPDCSVDVIVNIESACQYSNRRRFLAECARILKAGGRIATQDWVAADHITPENYHTFIEPMCQPWRIRSLETPGSYRKLLKESGFDVGEMVNLNGGVKSNFDYMYEVVRYIEQSNRSLTEDEQLWYRHLKTISHAYFNRQFVVIRYLAQLK